MASKHKQPLLEIDLNIEFTQAHVEDGSTPKMVELQVVDAEGGGDGEEQRGFNILREKKKEYGGADNY